MCKMLCLAVVILFCVSLKAAQAGHVFQHHGVEWETVGCFHDSWNRSLRNFFHDLHKDGLNKKALKKTGYKPYFDLCADEAKEHNYILFGIQYFAECWGDDDPNRNYAMNGAATNCHHSDVKDDFFQIGGDWSNYIYRAKPINGGFTEWGEWSECSVKCGGGGVQSSTRSCTNPKPRFKGKPCEGQTTRTQACGQKPCPVDGKWSDFSAWSKCTKSCGGGTQKRSRSCNNPAPAHGGKECVGEAKESRACGIAKCPVDGKWSDYSAWSKCTKSCGGGTQERSRSCNNPAPAHGGKKCVGAAKQTRACGTKSCAVDGKWSAFSAWSKCTKSCGGGTQERSRLCNNPAPAHGGKECVGEAKQSRACGTKKCPAEWKPLSGVVCTEGKGKKPAVFTPLLQGTATKLKLVYKSGFIRCANNKKHNSNWGCWDHAVLKRDSLNMVITDAQDTILLPTKFDFPGKWYKIKGVNSKSKELVFNSNVGMYISKSCPLKVWYGEDLVDHTAEDNSGKVCFQVYGFMIPEPDKPRCTIPKGKWAQLSRDPVCFEGKGKKPGEFSPLFQTSSKKLKLVHESGSIRCANDKRYDSYWGCWGHPILKHGGLDVVITDDNNKILLPTKFDFPRGKWYKLKGYNSKSKSLVFTSKAPLNLGGRLKVWYGEDLVDHTTEDNHGRICAQVFAYGA